MAGWLAFAGGNYSISYICALLGPHRVVIMHISALGRLIGENTYGGVRLH